MKITIPKLLADQLKKKKSRVEVKDSLALACWLIASRCRKNDFVPISYDAFEKFLRRNIIHPRLKLLQSLKVIECDGKYSARSKEKKSLGYRLTRKAKESGIAQHAITRRKWVKQLAKSPVHSVKLERPIYNLLVTSLYKTEINYEMAKSISEQESGKHFLLWMCAIESIHLRQFRHKSDDYGRFHSNITNLPSKLRPALMIHGKPLHEIDIACSQPTILAGLLCEQRGHADVAHYVSLCENGELYEFLMKETGVSCRATQKKALFHYVYGRVCNGKWRNESENMRAKNLVAEAFERVFPTVAQFIKDKKRLGYERLAHEMQRLESDLVIGVVCENLYAKYTGIDLLTVHDSILVEHSYIEKAKAELANAFLEELRIQPQIKAKHTNQSYCKGIHDSQPLSL